MGSTSLKITAIIVLYGGFVAFLFLTNPQKLPIEILIIPFIWIFCIFFVTLLLLMRAVVGQASTTSIRRKRRVLSAITAVVPTIILLLASINQLGTKDIAILLTLGVGIWFYVSRLHVNPKSY